MYSELDEDGIIRVKGRIDEARKLEELLKKVETSCNFRWKSFIYKTFITKLPRNEKN